MFKVYGEFTDVWKAEGDGPKSMRIGGLVSTDRLDKDSERVVQEGLDFGPFLADGWFNDNHSNAQTDVLGYPTSAKYVKKGAKLPPGTTAPRNGWYVEGYMLPTSKGKAIFELAEALKDTPRRLGFSIEGETARRQGNTIMRAVIKNVAITHCPVNVDTGLEVLAKALSAGSDVNNPGAQPGSGFALRAESIATEESTLDEWAEALQRSFANPPEVELTKSEARIIAKARFPTAPPSVINQIVNRAFRR